MSDRTSGEAGVSTESGRASKKDSATLQTVEDSDYVACSSQSFLPPCKTLFAVAGYTKLEEQDMAIRTPSVAGSS